MYSLEHVAKVYIIVFVHNISRKIMQPPLSLLTQIKRAIKKGAKKRFHGMTVLSFQDGKAVFLMQQNRQTEHIIQLS